MIELPPPLYFNARKALEGIEINALFALAVIEQHVTGKIFVDSLQNPTTFYIAHPYGMSLLVGQTTHKAFNHCLKEYLENTTQVRNRVEWLQVDPTAEWMVALEELLGETLVKTPENNTQEISKILYYQRINFHFSRAKYDARKVESRNHGCSIVRTSKEMFELMEGSVIPKYFWDNAEAFASKSMGYTMLDNEERVLATSFASFVIGNKLELGIETNAMYRGRGYAYAVASRLIDFCLEHAFEPIWACSSINKGSYTLAEKLGFEIVKKIPYYKLPYHAEQKTKGMHV